MKKLTKILLGVMFAVLLFIPAFTLSGCKKDEVDNTITVTFVSSEGDLSFIEMQFQLNAGGDVYLTESKCPTVSNESDDKIFKCWADSNGNQFDFSSEIKENITLYAVFEEAEMVWSTSWKTNNSVLSKYYEYHTVNDSGTQLGSVKTLNYVKVAKREATENSYVTKEFIENYSKLNNFTSLCFTTDSDGEQKVTFNDLTANTYYYICYFVVAPDLDATRGRLYGYFDYSIKGVTRTISSISAMFNYAASSGYDGVSGYSIAERKTTYRTFDNSLSINDLTLSSIRNCSEYDSTTDEKFQSDNYAFFIEVKGFKFISVSNGTKSYHYTNKTNGGLKNNVSYEEYSSVDYEN